MKNELQSFLIKKIGLLCVVFIAAGAIQSIIVQQSALDTSAKVWRLPQANGETLAFCIRRVCGWPSITALIFAPLAAAVTSLVFDALKMRTLENMRERGVLQRFENPFFQIQSVLVIVLLFGNVILGGAFTTMLFTISSLASLLAVQTMLACLAFVSLTLATLSGSASSRQL